ncbi:MAG: hypothetical protein CEE43_02010 [Promethearchaeota archaeon Loki_b32]|nr:MAG: hypothetical protein CEE43_02010 [Candidatus Lokiarchaeota archaeon Loki_b32]
MFPLKKRIIVKEGGGFNMENIIDGLKNMLKEQVSINIDDIKLKISLDFKGEKKRKDELGKESEVKDMLKVIGGLTEDIQMDINVDEESQKITIEFKNKEDMINVQNILENLWEKASELLKKAFLGDFMAIKDLGDFTE